MAKWLMQSLGLLILKFLLRRDAYLGQGSRATSRVLCAPSRPPLSKLFLPDPSMLVFLKILQEAFKLCTSQMI